MKIIKSIKEIDSAYPCAVALGSFDGVHIGHFEVIKAAVNAKELYPAVFTFWDNSHRAPTVVTQEDKEQVIKEAGIKLLFSIGFDEVQGLSAEDFFHEILLKKCKAKRICCGEDFRFGHGAKGTVQHLQKMCRETGTMLDIIPTVEMDGQRVSSTRIREALQSGDVETANKMLGRPFGFALEVVHGNHIGRGLGTPTINQALPEGFIMPKFGVYASIAHVDDEQYYGVTNIGVKPTVGSDHVLSETWMPEFSGDLYGKRVRLSIYAFIRPEKKFCSLEEMKIEIVRNGQQAKKIIEPGTPLEASPPLLSMAKAEGFLKSGF